MRVNLKTVKEENTKGHTLMKQSIPAKITEINERQASVNMNDGMKMGPTLAGSP